MVSRRRVTLGLVSISGLVGTIGVFGSAPDGGPALLATAAPPRAAGVAEVRPPVPHPALKQRPGVIEIDLPEGVRVRVDAFVNERALDRVLRVLKGRA